MTEIPMGGGNVSSGVVRVGDTVRRPVGPWTPAVHALLGHLHAAGFYGAPWPRGLDEHGREVLTFIPGTIPWPDNFHLLDPDDRLRRVARLIRDFHDAVTGFCPPPDARWQALIPAEGTGIIAHHDLAPWNLVTSPHRWAFIDWDHRRPRVTAMGPRLRPARLRAAQREPALPARQPCPPDAPVRWRLRPGPGPAPRTAPHAGPADQGHARLPRRAGSRRHPALGTSLARRPRPCLAGRHRLHRRTARHLAPRAA